ncbi:MAG: NUDIX hydrolase [Armatimonadetes bacterium]|nr:NUDIX hydrolase [Armatimonadota bacterium]
MIDQSWYARPPGVPAHTSAGGVVVRVERGRVYVALVREGDLPGYVLPKGHVEAGERPEEAARREIFEEAGLGDLRMLSSLGVRERLDYGKTSWKQTHYFLFLTDQVHGTAADRRHALAWFPIDDLPAMFWPEQRELIESNRARIVALMIGLG